MSSLPTLSFNKYQLATTNHEQPLIAVGKRYVNSAKPPSSSGTVLLLAHGTGYHKEIWEPTLRHLFSLDKKSHIREAWAVDCQNHGESGVLNEETLVRHPGILGIYDYADALASFYREFIRPTTTAENQVVLIAHSAGTAGAVLATSWFNPPSKIPFHSVILIEPPIFPKEKLLDPTYQTPLYQAFSAISAVRRENWASREAARAWMAKRPPWAMWDPEVLDVYVKYGLRELPTMLQPHAKGVTLTCHREDEARAYSAGATEFGPIWRLNQICPTVPVHLIWGANDDLFSAEQKASMVDPEQGRTFSSIRRVEDVGHLVKSSLLHQTIAQLVQILMEKPSLLAEALLSIISPMSAAKL